MRYHSSWIIGGVVALLAISLAAEASAQIRGADVAVDGMACPFCAYGIEKRLRKVDGVESVTVHLEEGIASLAAAEGTSIDVRQIASAVRAAGFTPGPIMVEAMGTIKSLESNQWTLSGAGDIDLLRLRAENSELAERLRALAESRLETRVRGKLETDSGSPPVIVVESLERASG